MKDGISNYGVSGRPALLNCLWHFQLKDGHINDGAVRHCADLFDMSIVEVEGVLSFYHFFSRRPRGEFTVYLNSGPIAHNSGFHRIRSAFERETGSVFGDTDVTDRFGLFDTACIGLSDQEPAALINFHPFTNLNTLKVRDIVAQLRQGARVEDICDDVRDNIRYSPPGDRTILLRNYTPGLSLDRMKALGSPQLVIEEIRKSGLKGMGGAYFPTGTKWQYCATESAQPKYVVCNADEGEPGTFKDRVLLNSYTGLILEGMILAGYAIGSDTGIIYLRAEYMWLRPKLEAALSDFRQKGYLGTNVCGIKGFNFNIRIQLGAGSYVCGEETALLNSLEGKRGEPRTRQYFPTQRGFLGKPTIVNNVETFCAAARIIELGAGEFRKCGTSESPGTKLISVSGDCDRPGVYEIEWGTPVHELLDLCGAPDPYFIQVSGPSGECISEREHRRKISVEDLSCGGSFMIFNSDRNLADVLINFADFFKSESCGVCTPCRAGNYLIRTKLEKLRRGLVRDQDLHDISEWGKIMRSTSRCGLGRSATRSLGMALTKFKNDFGSSADTDVLHYNRGFSLEDAVREYEQFNAGV